MTLPAPPRTVPFATGHALATAQVLARVLLLASVLVAGSLSSALPAAAQTAAQRDAQGRPEGTASRLGGIELSQSGPDGSTTLLARIGAPGDVRHFVLEDPSRIVIDVDGVTHDLVRTDLPNLRLGSLRGVRTSQFGPSTVRIVLDLSERIGYEVRIVDGGVRIDLEEVVAPLSDATAAATPPTRAGATGRRRPAATLPLLPEGPVVAVVTEIAGSTLYVDAGTRQGLFDGDTLSVSDRSDGSRVGALTVLSSATDQSLLTFGGRPFPITLGDSLNLTPPHIDRAVRVASGPTATTTPASRTPEPQLTLPLPPTVSGRIHFSMNAQSSSTRWGAGAEPLSRSFLTPTTRLRLEVADLPGKVTLTANVRGSYRHDATGLVDQAGSLRVYDLSIEKRFDRAPVRVQAGRFYSPYESFSGYFDGALVRVGPDGFGVGGAFGLEPDRWNEGFSRARPKRSAFMDFSAIGTGRGVTGEVAAVQILPANDGAEQLYFGWAGQAWIGALNISHTAQIDRDPTTGGWVVSDLLVQGGLPLAGPLRLRGSWSRRSPFYFWQTAAPVSYRRDDVGGGFSLDLTGGSVSGDVAIHQAEGDSAWSRSYAGSFRIHSIAGTRVGLNGSASSWEDRSLRMLSVATGVDRSWGRSFGRLGYRMIDSRSAWFELLSHQAEALIDVPVQPGVRATVMGHARVGRGLRSYRIQLGFWRSF